MKAPLHDEELAELAIDGDHLEICWTPDGTATFYPNSANSERLALRLAELVEVLYERPEAILHAAGIHPH